MKRVVPEGGLKRLLYLLKKNKTPIFIIVFLAFILVFINLSTKPRDRKLELISVLIVKNNLLRGRTIKEEDLMEMSFVKGFVPENAIATERKREVVGKTALTFLLKGDVITPHSFGKTLTDIPFPISKILKGDEKAFYIKREDIATVPAGLTLSDRVDVFGVNKEKTVQERVLENAEVIDIRQASQDVIGNIELIGLALSDNRIEKLTKVIAEDWFLEIVILPKE